MHAGAVVLRISRFRHPARRSTYRSTAGEGERDKKHGDPLTPTHYLRHQPWCPYPTAISSIRLGSLFLILPTRGLTGPQVILSDR